MSHIVTVATEVRDPVAVASACRRLGLAEPEHGTVKLFQTEASRLLVHLPDWLYPCVCDVLAGTLRYDNYGGAWGDPVQLDRFLQCYAIERATLEARKKGHAVTEQALADGSIKLTIQVGGAA